VLGRATRGVWLPLAAELAPLDEMPDVWGVAWEQAAGFVPLMLLIMARAP